MKRLIAAMAVIALLAAGCGDDDDEPTATEETTTTGGQAAAGNVRAYCDAILAIETAPPPDVDFETLAPEQAAQVGKDYARTTIRPLADKVVATAPEAIKANVAVLSRAVDEVIQTGNFGEAFEKPEAQAAEERTHQYDLDNCGWNVSRVTAVDYAFQGIPQALRAGVTSFDLTVAADAKEVHELTVLRKNPGVTESFEQVLQLPEEQGQAKVTVLGTVEPTAPGEDGYSYVRLEPGQYLAACFLPVGATPAVFEQVEAGQAQPPEGPPHAVGRRMYTEFTVR